MKKPERFVLYRKEYGTNRFRVNPAGALGFLAFFSNLALFFIGIFNLVGVWDFLSKMPALIALVFALAFYVYSLIFLTDYSNPNDEL